MQLQIFGTALLFLSCIAEEKPPTEEDSAAEEAEEENNDVDGDGFEIGEDCNDSNAAIHPAAEEVCDGLDNNCDEQIDEGDLCPCEYSAYDGIGYFFCEQQVVWSEAVATCPTLRNGYELLSINDETEDVWIYEQFNLVDGNARWWISLNDIDEEGVFRWGDGQLPKYTNWDAAEPNDSGGEDCAELNRFYNDEWNDIRCDASIYFICEGPR